MQGIFARPTSQKQVTQFDVGEKSARIEGERLPQPAFTANINLAEVPSR